MQEKWSIVIKPKVGLFEIDYKELFQYRDLILLFVKRSFSSQYKQTILGPLWFVLNPMITTVLYMLVFGGIAGFSTEGAPQFAFYLASIAIWQYFATCLANTSSTFTTNSGILGKVYFPRLVLPISTVLFALINFGVVFVVTIIIVLYNVVFGYGVHISWYILLIPLLVLQTALFGLGVGILIAALTTKYRDLVVLVSFGIQLWMYATPVVYSMSELSEQLKKIIVINPMSAIVNNFRYALLGCGEMLWGAWIYSWGIVLFVLLVGVLLFNKVEKTFMDTV